MDKLHKGSSRRTVLKTVTSVAVSLALTQWSRAANSAAPTLTPVDPADPQAKALGYAPDTAKVDAKLNPTHKPEQHCGNCVQFQGKPTDKVGGCNLFAGKQVPSNAWCRVWTQRPA